MIIQVAPPDDQLCRQYMCQPMFATSYGLNSQYHGSGNVFFYNFPSQRFDRRATYLWQSNCLIVEMTLDIWGGEWCICAANANASHISILTKQAVKLELQGRGRDHLIWRWICNLAPPPPPPSAMLLQRL